MLESLVPGHVRDARSGSCLHGVVMIGIGPVVGDGIEESDVAVTQAVEDELEDAPSIATRAILRPRRAAIRSNSSISGCRARTRMAASTAAQRTSVEPCLVIRPRITVVSDS